MHFKTNEGNAYKITTSCGQPCNTIKFRQCVSTRAFGKKSNLPSLHVASQNRSHFGCNYSCKHFANVVYQ
eukprot:12889485-Prorocentrum_lima.AAC.1